MHLPPGFLSLAIILSCSACSSNSSTSGAGAKGNARLTFDRTISCIYEGSTIGSPNGGPPTDTDLGGTVSNGKNYQVSCKLAASGASYSLDAHLESSVMSLNIQSSDISVGSEMIFFVAGAGGTPDPVCSVDAKNDVAPTCTVTTTRSDTVLTVGPGTIVAEFDCPKVMAATNVSAVCHAKGLFQFTGCGD